MNEKTSAKKTLWLRTASIFSCRLRGPANLVIVLAISFSSANAASFDWKGEAGAADWNKASNWQPGTGFPNAAGDVAHVTADIASGLVINLNQAITVGAITLGDAAGDPPSPYMIDTGAGGSLIFNNGGSAATLTKSNSTTLDVISADLTIGAEGLIVDTPASSNPVLNIEGKISGGNLTKTGDGVISLSGDNTGWSGTISVNRGGVYTLDNDTATNALTANNALVIQQGAIFYANTTSARPGALTVASVSGRGSVSLNGSDRYLNVGGGAPVSNTVTVDGTSAFLSPGDSTVATGTLTLSIDNVTENINVTLATGSLILDINGDTEHDILSIRSSKDANEGSTLSINNTFVLVLHLGYAPAEGTLFKIVDINGPAPIAGNFSARDAVSTKFGEKTYIFEILYNSSLGGGDGNDIVLRVRKEP